MAQPDLHGEMLATFEREEMQDLCGETMRPGGLALTERALQFCNLPQCSMVLDVGCGSGATLRRLEGSCAGVFGVDVSALNLRRCGIGSFKLTRGLGQRLPYASGSMDAVLVECTLSIMDDIEDVLREFRRVLSPGGWLILSDLYSRVEGGVGRWMTRVEILRVLQDCGFALELWEDHSRELKETAARMILKHGSLDGFFACLPRVKGQQGEDQGQAWRNLKPGYYLAISTKRA